MRTKTNALLIGLIFTACVPYSGADIILHSGLILSMDRFQPPAQALAIVDGKILAVGSNAEIMPLGNWSTRKVNLKGATVLPGLTDSHFHLAGFGRHLESLDLFGTKSAEQVARRVARQAAQLPPGTWITGRGWDQNDWNDQIFPDRSLLDAVAPDHPVALSRVDGHAIWANSVALGLAGIDANSRDPAGGRIIRRDNGEPTGVLIDNAMSPITAAIPKPSTADIRRRLENAIARLNEVGLTSVHDPGVDQTTLDILIQMADEGVLSIRYYGMLNGGDPELLQRHFDQGPTIDYKQRVTIRAVKLYGDGALGSRGAALLSAYSDDPGNRGLTVTSAGDLESVVDASIAAGFQPAIHAIGDRAVRTALDIYEKMLDKYADIDFRPRIEYAQVITRRDIRRFGKLGVIASMQPSHATSDMYWAEERLGSQRIKGAYAWKSLLEAKVTIAGGSDCPVEREEPLLQLFAARTRQDTTGWPEAGWYRSQRMSGLAAARSMTAWAAIAAFTDSTRGRILPGFDADLTILSRNPVGDSPKAILETKVLTTMLGGQTVWRDAKAWNKMPLPPFVEEESDDAAMEAASR